MPEKDTPPRGDERDRVAQLKAFGHAIRDQRVQLGLSVRGLAATAEISPAYLTSIERGRNPTTGRPPAPSLEVVRRLANALGTDPTLLLAELDWTTRGVNHDHVLLYCLQPPRRGIPELLERAFGSQVDHWLYIADPREAETDDFGGSATIVRWELGAFPYRTPYLQTDAVMAALDLAVRSIPNTVAPDRLGLASADSSAVMRWVQNPDEEVALERTWHEHVNATCLRHLGTRVAIDVCVYHHEDIEALGITIDQIATALALVRDHHRVLVYDDDQPVNGALAIRRMLERVRPVGVSTSAWKTLTEAAAETLASRQPSA